LATQRQLIKTPDPFYPPPSEQAPVSGNAPTAPAASPGSRVAGRVGLIVPQPARSSSSFALGDGEVGYVHVDPWYCDRHGGGVKRDVRRLVAEAVYHDVKARDVDADESP